jgi:hypothetical protein
MAAGWLALVGAIVGAVSSKQNADSANRGKNTYTDQATTQTPWLSDELLPQVRNALDLNRRQNEQGYPIIPGGHVLAGSGAWPGQPYIPPPPNATPTSLGIPGRPNHGGGGPGPPLDNQIPDPSSPVPTGGVPTTNDVTPIFKSSQAGGDGGDGGGGGGGNGGGGGGGRREMVEGVDYGRGSSSPEAAAKRAQLDAQAGVGGGSTSGSTGGGGGAPAYDDYSSIFSEVAKRGFDAGNDPTTKAAQDAVQRIAGGGGAAGPGGTGFESYNPILDRLTHQTEGEGSGAGSKDLMQFLAQAGFGPGAAGGAGGQGGGGPVGPNGQPLNTAGGSFTAGGGYQTGGGGVVPDAAGGGLFGTEARKVFDSTTN